MSSIHVQTLISPHTKALDVLDVLRSYVTSRMRPLAVLTPLGNGVCLFLFLLLCFLSPAPEGVGVEFGALHFARRLEQHEQPY